MSSESLADRLVQAAADQASDLVRLDEAREVGRWVTVAVLRELDTAVSEAIGRSEYVDLLALADEIEGPRL